MASSARVSLGSVPTQKHGTYGETVVKEKLSDDHELVLKTFRLLIADLCQQFNGGHPGGAIGMAAIGVALWKYVMRYAPHSPDWFNRDRFILSNGHTCLFQYAFLHLTGYKEMTFDQLKSYHSDRADSLCPGHPEREIEGIEVTTGPLGQGVANAVGLVMATKNLGATYNRPGFDVVSNHTWCMVGDACLQEGIALEAISLAGHLRLDNLTVIYDNNQITCDGSVDLTNTEDVSAKMRACNWDVIDIDDGSYDVEAIVAALERARSHRRATTTTTTSSAKPTFVNVRTIIGLGSAAAGSAVAHGAALGAADVGAMKATYGFDPAAHFVVPPRVTDFFAPLPARGERLVRDWEGLVDRYAEAHPALAAELRERMAGRLVPATWRDLIPASFPDAPTASRASSGLVFNPIAQHVRNFMVGTADLSPSVSMAWPDKVDFQNPDLQTQCGLNGTYAGRYVHYGVREHAMCGIANGLAAFSPGAIVPVTASFFMFYLYAAPAVRMGALQGLQVIHAATHDSIGMGEDGPTHHPVELAALYRAMPGLLYLRPGDSEEVAGAWEVAIENTSGPTIISTSRHKLPQLRGLTRRDGIRRGAYVLREAASSSSTSSSEAEAEPADVTLLGVGAELSLAIAAADELFRRHGVAARVVSFPSWRLFERQPRSYRRDVLRRHGVPVRGGSTGKGTPAVAVEPYAPNGWERYADAAVCLTRFGKSLPEGEVYRHFGFDARTVADRVAGWLRRVEEGELLRGEFEEI
ncbi:putative transketolase [Xylariaceae sp. FL0804]|nr:putative transketolase [Xylariaceae sp. FL0804]